MSTAHASGPGLPLTARPVDAVHAPAGAVDHPSGSGMPFAARLTLAFLVVAAAPLVFVWSFVAHDDTLMQPTIAITVVAMAVALLVGRIATEPTVRALRQLERATRNLALGDFEAPIRLEVARDLGEVSRELRRVAAQFGRQRYEYELLEAATRDKIQRGELSIEVLEKQNARLRAQSEALQQFALATARMLDPAQIAGELLAAVNKEVEYTHAVVFLTAGPDAELTPVAVCDHGARSVGNYLKETRSCRSELGYDVASWGLQVGRTVRIDDLALDGRWSNCLPEVRSALLVPLEVKEKSVGILKVCHEEPRRYRSREVEELVVALARQAALAIEHGRLMREAAEVAALRQLDRFKSDLLSTVSHELRTPLASIKGYATTLLREDVTWDADTTREFLQIIDEESDRLRSLIDDLLQMSEIEAGILRIRRQPVSLGRLGHRVVKRLRPQARQHTISGHFPANLPAVEADLQRVEQVLRNLLTNAIKYSPDGGAIRVTAQAVVGSDHQYQPAGLDQEQRPTRVLVAVKDEGIGIAAEHLPHIFERFYRVEGDVAWKAGGSGLGLAICRGIIEAHGGAIWAESVAGAGTTFFFTLPVHEGETIQLENDGAEE
ncbi:MAG: GAF domain-containing protein [Chloroflexi bacterium]|nr:GAF domain-containing protein [Chloroflexota bacterium]